MRGTAREYTKRRLSEATARGQARTKLYYNHTGIFFHETKTLYGGLNSGLNAVPWKAWPHHNHTYMTSFQPYTGKDVGGNAGGTEVSFMVLDAWEYTGDDRYLTKYLPLATLTVDFFRQHYVNRTEDGRVVVWPTQALESFWCQGWNVTEARPPDNCCVNDMPTVASLHALVRRLLALPARFSTGPPGRTRP